MCTRALLTVLLICASTAQADPLADWFSREDAVLVVLLIDGLSDELVDARTPDGDALMPRVSAWAEQAMRFSDVLASNTNAGPAREQLEGELDRFGAARSVMVDPADLTREIATLGTRAGRQVLVFEIPWLLPPLDPGRATLERLDPAPWASMRGVVEIELQLTRRLDRAAFVAGLRTRADLRNQPGLLRDTRWVIEAAHADLDARLGSILDALLDPTLAPRTAVLVTATSSSGLGERGPAGPGSGVELDVARVPVIFRVPDQAPRIDHAPRQWLWLDAEWFRSPGPADRFTSSTSAGSSSDHRVCEMRWTTPEFTVIDIARPQGPPRLYDRQIDPGEWLDQSVSLPALADSLRTELRARLYGPAPVIVFSAGDEEVELDLGSRSKMEGPPGRNLSSLRLEPGEVLRVRLIDGAANVDLGQERSVQIGDEGFRIEELVVHSPEWRAAMDGPGSGMGFRIWIE